MSTVGMSLIMLGTRMSATPISMKVMSMTVNGLSKLTGLSLNSEHLRILQIFYVLTIKGVFVGVSLLNGFRFISVLWYSVYFIILSYFLIDF